ncbi:uncharacterized protein LOC144240845 [Crocuta crocuta]
MSEPPREKICFSKKKNQSFKLSAKNSCRVKHKREHLPPTFWKLRKAHPRREPVPTPRSLHTRTLQSGRERESGISQSLALGPQPRLLHPPTRRRGQVLRRRETGCTAWTQVGPSGEPRAVERGHVATAARAASASRSSPPAPRSPELSAEPSRVSPSCAHAPRPPWTSLSSRERFKGGSRTASGADPLRGHLRPGPGGFVMLFRILMSGTLGTRV